MIAPLRARHAWMFAVLVVTLPVAFALAIRARDDERNSASLPNQVAGDGPDLGQPGNSYVTLHDGREFHYTFGSQPRVVAVEQVRGERAPDLLVYWTPSAPQMRELPAGSVLLGAIGERERRFALPEPVRENSGAFAVFSLAHGEVVAVQSLESIR